MRGRSRPSLPAPDLVDVALDELDLRVAVEVVLDDLLGQLDRQLRTLARRSAIARSAASRMSSWTHAGRISAASGSALAIRSWRTCSACSRASSMIWLGLVAGVGELPAVVREHASRPRPCAASARSRSVRIRSSRSFSFLRHRGRPNFHMSPRSTRNASPPQIDLVGLGEDRVRRLLAVVDRPAGLEDLDALLGGVVFEFTLGGVGHSRARPPPRTRRY